MNRINGSRSRGPWLRMSGDILAALLALGLAFLVRIHVALPFTQNRLPTDRLQLLFNEWWVVAASQVAVLYFFGMYDPPRTGSGNEGNRRLLTCTGVQGLGLMVFYFLSDRGFPRSVLLLFVVFNFLLLALWRAGLRRVRQPPPRRIAIVGQGSAARELAEKIGYYAGRSLVVAGYVPQPGVDGSAEPSDNQILGKALGSVEDLPELMSSGEIDDIVLATRTQAWQTRLLDHLSELQPGKGNVLLVPGPIDSLIGRMRYRWVNDVPLIEVVRQTEWTINRPIKRLVDLIVGSGLLIAVSPVMLLCAAAIAITSKGPVFYRQNRIGHARQPFTLWKFRTMHPDAEKDTGEVLSSKGDPRLIRIGALLRRLRLDELPQLFNVLGGTMSLVGPRPERPGFVRRYLEEIPGYPERFSVPPGLTGLAQVNGDYHSTPENKLRYELAYIANWSPVLDFAILVRTVKIVLTSRGV